MQRIFSFIATLSVAILFHSQVQAVVIETSRSALVPPIASNAKAQTLENALNTEVFAPIGMDIEFGAPTGGTSAVDDMAFEGPGLTVITSSGFILRFDNPVDQVRVRFGNFKDDFDRQLRAFDFAADYTRSTTVFSQSINGNVTSFPDLSLATDLATGTLPRGSTGFLDLIVNDPGNISSVLVTSNKFLWTLEEIEVMTNPVPIPAALLLFVSGLAGLGFIGRRKKRAV